VRAIIAMAHSLRLSVIAEGVETEAQFASLKALGCDEYQGFHASAALPPAEFERRFAPA
jgi:diguanylate cyclase